MLMELPLKQLQPYLNQMLFQANLEIVALVASIFQHINLLAAETFLDCCEAFNKHWIFSFFSDT